jgi:hypothetical protein
MLQFPPALHTLNGASGRRLGTVRPRSSQNLLEQEDPTMSSRLLTALCLVGLSIGLSTPAARADDSAGQVTSGQTTAEQSIKEALREKTQIEFADTPLKDAIDYYKDKHHIEIVFDSRALKEANLDPSAVLITLNVKGISLRSALHLILDQYNLTWVIRDEVMLVTTQNAAAAMLTNRVYDVRDLVGGANSEGLDELVETITTTVAPATWNSTGGSGMIHAYSTRGVDALVVAQTDSTQDKIDQLLSDLRKLKAPPLPLP